MANLLNRALCYLKLQWPKKACLALQKALDIDNNSAKAMYRMGRAKRMLCDYKEARRYLIRALNIEPSNSDIGRELSSLDELMRQQDEDERALYQRMFQAPKQRNNTSYPSQRVRFLSIFFHFGFGLFLSAYIFAFSSFSCHLPS